MAYSQDQLVSFGLNLAATHLSVAGIIASYYLIKEFRSFLSYALILMHGCYCVKVLLSTVAALQLLDSVTILSFLSWFFNSLSLGLYMLQMMERLWLLPPSGDWLGDRHYKAGLSQWFLFSLAMSFFALNSICWLPVGLDQYISCHRYANIFLAVAIAFMLLLCVGSSFYMIVAVTHSKVSQDRKADYLRFSRRRLPILSLNIVISISIGVVVCLDYQHNLDLANYLFSWVILTSTYYFVDFKEFMLLSSDSKSSGQTNAVTELVDGRISGGEVETRNNATIRESVEVIV